MRIAEQIVIAVYLFNSYKLKHQPKAIISGLLCLVFAAFDFFAGLAFGYWTRNPIGLLVLYVVHWIAVVCYIGLGCAFIANEFVFAVVLWAQMGICYVLFSLKLHR